jgi:hypothetical protein
VVPRWSGAESLYEEIDEGRLLLDQALNPTGIVPRGPALGFAHLLSGSDKKAA